MKAVIQSLIYGATGRMLVDPRRYDIVEKTDQPPVKKLDGLHSRKWWETRDAGANSSADAYWASRNHPLRTAIGTATSSLDGFSLLEVGCHAGMNLWAAAQRKKWEHLAGIELSETILRFARETLPMALGQTVELHQASADALPFADDSFDIVLTAGTLVCIGPDDIEKSISELCRVSRRWIVLVEPIEIDPRFATTAGREDPFPNTTYWIRNYIGMLADRADIRSLTPLLKEEQIGHLNSIAIFELRR